MLRVLCLLTLNYVNLKYMKIVLQFYCTFEHFAPLDSRVWKVKNSQLRVNP